MQLVDYKLVLGSDFCCDMYIDQKNFDVGDGISYLDVYCCGIVFGFYVQDELVLCLDLLFNFGLCYDYYVVMGGSINFWVGFIYWLQLDIVFKVFYGSVYWLFNVYEFDYVINIIGGIKVGLMFKVEIMWFIELVLEYVLGVNQCWFWLVFYNNVSNLIVIILDFIDGLYFIENIEGVWVVGSEIEWEGCWLNGVCFKISVSWQKVWDKQIGEIVMNLFCGLFKMYLLGFMFFLSVWCYGLEIFVVIFWCVFNGEVFGYLVSNVNLVNISLVCGFELLVGLYNFFDQKFYDLVGNEYW